MCLILIEVGVAQKFAYIVKPEKNLDMFFWFHI